MPTFSASSAVLVRLPLWPEGEAGPADRAVDGLGAVPVRGAVGRVAGVADGQVALQARQGALVEDGGDEAHVLDDHDGLAVGHGHPGRLLAAVLECEETVEGEVGHPRPGA